jgi:ribosomal protein L18E
VVAAIGIVFGLVSVRRGSPLVKALSRLAALTAVAALALVAAAVLGDGFFEIAKHVWLAAYLLEVTAAAALLAGVAACVRLRARRG